MHVARNARGLRGLAARVEVPPSTSAKYIARAAVPHPLARGGVSWGVAFPPFYSPSQSISGFAHLWRQPPSGNVLASLWPAPSDRARTQGQSHRCSHQFDLLVSLVSLIFGFVPNGFHGIWTYVFFIYILVNIYLIYVCIIILIII